jgi:ATP-dependent exoDNAse (exonuclease V) beta subunit
MFYPEVTMSSKLNKTYEGRDDLSILGRIDLLVVGSDGTPHIIDFKTSPKHYEDYSTAKALGFTY